jgi:hypothetical protein
MTDAAFRSSSQPAAAACKSLLSHAPAPPARCLYINATVQMRADWVLCLCIRFPVAPQLLVELLLRSTPSLWGQVFAFGARIRAL